MRAEEAWKKMTKRIEVERAPAPLEEYVKPLNYPSGDQADLSGELQYPLRELPDNSYKSSAAGYGVVDVGFLRVTIAL